MTDIKVTISRVYRGVPYGITIAAKDINQITAKQLGLLLRQVEQFIDKIKEAEKREA